MDEHLATSDWLAREHATIADVSCFGPISMLKVSGYDTDRWPAVARWLQRVGELPRAIDPDGKPYS
jgi:glutathione S-transferase